MNRITEQDITTNRNVSNMNCSHRMEATDNDNKFSTVVGGKPRAPFSIVTTSKCRGGRYSFPWTAPIYNALP